MTWVAIVGSRNLGECACKPHFPPTPEERAHENQCPRVIAFKRMLRIVTKLAQDPGFSGIVSGGADGADHLAELAATALGVKAKIFKPEGGSEPFAVRAKARNQRIVDHADMVIAIYAPGPRSPGTSDTVQRARTKGIPIHIWHEGRWHEQ